MNAEESLQQDIEFLRGCQKRLVHIIEAMENLSSFRMQLEMCKRREDKAQEYAELMKQTGVLPLAEIERKAILGAVELFDGDKTKAAKALGVGKTTVFRKFKQYQAEER
jgi:transcriptional regulator with PAS, ATPase and Fis domain